MKSRQGYQTRVNILLPDDLYNAFRDRCDYAGVSMASVVRKYVERECDMPTFTASPKPEPDPEVAAINAEAKRLVGEEIARRDADIIKRQSEGEQMTKLAKEYGISLSRVSRIVARARV